MPLDRVSAIDSLTTLRVNLDWASLPLFDRTGWTRVRFGDVVQNVNETVDPVKAGLDRFIGLEHLEPRSLQVRSWGNVADGTTFTRRCRSGQVLFGKRRAYQRKVAVADFDAVVSGDIYVLAPSNERLMFELLPFLCLSERFFEHAVGTSAGSLSPRTNWSSLANCEFDLPPLDQQRRVAALLCGVDDVLVRWAAAQQIAQTTHDTQLRALLVGSSPEVDRSRDIDDFLPPKGWAVRRAVDLVTSPITKGATPTGHLNTPGATIPFIKIYNLTFTGELDFTVDPTYVEPEIHRTALKRSRVLPGDVLMNLVGPPLGKTAIVPPSFPEGNVNQAIAIYRIQDPDLRAFFLEYLGSDLAQRWLERRSKKTSGQRNLTLQLAQDLPVPIPPPEVIANVLQTKRSIVQLRHTMRSAAATAMGMRESLLNSVW